VCATPVDRYWRSTGAIYLKLQGGDIRVAEKDELISREGKVTQALNNLQYRVQLDEGPEILCYSAGRMRRFRIRILVGDRVSVELSPYDLSKGRIVYRHR
jgi:translation initiation factor IF-1